MQSDAVIFRNPRRNHYHTFSAKLHIFLFGLTHEIYRSPIDKQKTTHSGVGGKKLNDLPYRPGDKQHRGIKNTGG